MKLFALETVDLKFTPLEDIIFKKFKDDKNINWIKKEDLKDMAAVPPVHITDEEYQKIWNDILTNGMKDAFIITVGEETNKARLDAGNHRLQLFLKNESISIIPVNIKNVKDHKLSPGNGLHDGIETDEFMKRLI